jgi:hypothetical protein
MIRMTLGIGESAKRLMILLVLALSSPPSYAQWRERRAALQEMHTVGEFRIFFSLSGNDALPRSEDLDRSGTPDFVERLARALATAGATYEQEFRLRHPLRSPRYRNQTEFIDINVLRFPLNANGPRNGVAYDEISSFDRAHDHGRKVRVLVIDIANDLSVANRTPAHELFHLYQNGYTFFKNRWYTEGTARWVEDLRVNHSKERTSWPRSSTDVYELFGKSYESSSFWQSIALKVDSKEGGRFFVRAFLEELDRADDAVNSRNAATWSEKDQFAKSNDAYIWSALRATLQKPMFSDRWNEDIQRLMEIKP